MRKKTICLLVAVALVLALLSGCGGRPEPDEPADPPETENTSSVLQEASESVPEEESSQVQEVPEEENLPEPDISEANAGAGEIAGEEVSNETDGVGEAEQNTMNLQIGDRTFTATLAENSSAEALKELLRAGPVTVDMQDYGNMEKVGDLGTSLPRNDEQISTGPGDLILYQGNSFVIYYGTNSWSLTRLGKIDDVTQEELKEALGSGNVTVILSLG